MKELSEETIKDLVNSEHWKILKRDLLIPYLNLVKDVTTPIEVNGIKLEGGEAYNTKVYTVEKLKGLIAHIERFKNFKRGSRKFESYK